MSHRYLDLAPTLLDLLGVTVPVHMQGRSLRPLLLGATPANWQQEYMFGYTGTTVQIPYPRAGDPPYWISAVNSSYIGLRIVNATHDLVHTECFSNANGLKEASLLPEVHGMHPFFHFDSLNRHTRVDLGAPCSIAPMQHCMLMARGTGKLGSTLPAEEGEDDPFKLQLLAKSSLPHAMFHLKQVPMEVEVFDRLRDPWQVSATCIVISLNCN